MWKFLRELFREQPPPSPERLAEPPEEFLGVDPPDWVINWTLHILPGGIRHQGGLTLWETSSRMTGGIHTAVRSGPESPTVEFKVPAAAASMIWNVLRNGSPENLTYVNSDLRDGCPMILAVYRREPYLGVRVRCNVSDTLVAGLELVPEFSRMTDIPPVCEAAGRPFPPTLLLGCALFDLTPGLYRDSVASDAQA